LIGDFFSVVQKMMIMNDGEKHSKQRQAAQLGFEDEIIERFESKVTETIRLLLKKAVHKEKFDFMKEIAQKLPSTVLADLFCIPEQDREQFLEWSGTMTAFFGGAVQYENSDGIKANLAASSLRNYFQELINQRRLSPGEDYISNLLIAQKRFDLSDIEIISQAIMMLVAGQVTTTDQIGNIIYLLASRPELQSFIRTNPDKIPNVIEELKRFDPAVTFLFRVAKEDCVLGAQTIHAGETLFISTHVQGRQDDLHLPNHIDPNRNNFQHFAYGHGPHYCLGAKLGRLQIRELIAGLIEATESFDLLLEEKPKRDHYSLSFSGFESLPLKVVSCTP
jgi:cytochrome P450